MEVFKMEKLLKLQMDLQMFADGGDGAGDQGEGATEFNSENNAGQSVNDTDNGDKDNKTATDPDTPFKAFKSEQEWQSSVDKLIQAAIKTHDDKKANEAQQQKDYDKMTDLEKANYDRDQLSKQLAESQRHSTIVENKAKLTERLGSDDLPTSLIAAFSDDVLAETSGVDKAYQDISQAFTDSLQKAIDKRIAASGTTLPGSNTSTEKSEGKTVAESLNKSQQATKSSLWATN